MLTGKAKEDYVKWYNENYYHRYDCKYDSEKDFENALNKLDILRDSLYTEWLDSVGIFITIRNKFGHRKKARIFWYSINEFKTNGFVFLSRAIAVKEAIKNANNVYNSRKKKTKTEEI